MFAAGVERLCGDDELGAGEVLEAAAAAGDPVALFLSASLDPALADQRLSLSASKDFTLAQTALAARRLASDHTDAASVSALRHVASSSDLADDVATAQAHLAASALQGGDIKAAVPLLLTCGQWLLDPCAPPRHVQAARRALRNLAALLQRGPSFSKHIIPLSSGGVVDNGYTVLVRDALQALCMLSVAPPAMEINHSPLHSSAAAAHVDGGRTVPPRDVLVDTLRSACPSWPTHPCGTQSSSQAFHCTSTTSTTTDLAETGAVAEPTTIDPSASIRLIRHLRNNQDVSGSRAGVSEASRSLEGALMDMLTLHGPRLGRVIQPSDLTVWSFALLGKADHALTVATTLERHYWSVWGGSCSPVSSPPVRLLWVGFGVSDTALDQTVAAAVQHNDDFSSSSSSSSSALLPPPALFVSRLPQSKALTTKNGLAMHLHLHFNPPSSGGAPLIAPESWVLPQQSSLLLARHLELEAEAECERSDNGGLKVSQQQTFSSSSSIQKPPVYIIKPCAGNRGKGIVITDSLKEHFRKLSSDGGGGGGGGGGGDSTTADILSRSPPCVVSTYISNPLLINGNRKFDVRLYVIVMAEDTTGAAAAAAAHPGGDCSVPPPHTVGYVFGDGLVRFAAQPYDAVQSRDFNQHGAHLTNFSIQKNSASAFKGAEFEVKSCWSQIAGVLQRETGISADTLWGRMSHLLRQVVQSFGDSVLAEAGRPASSTVRPFALFGFDVMIDDNCRPWLLEVNAQPSLAVNTAADRAVKTPMVAAMLSLLMAQPNNNGHDDGGWQNLNCT